MQRVMRLAFPRDAVLARWEMTHAGIGDETIESWLIDDFLRRMHRGVYHVGGGALTCRGRLRGAMHRGGKNAYVAGYGALYLGRAIQREPYRIELVSTTSDRDFDAVRVRRTTSLPARERVEYDGIRSVSVARAITDLAHDNPPLRLVRWMRNAEFHGNLRIEDVRAAEHRLASRGHAPALRTALHELEADNGGTDSALEDHLLELMIGAKLPLARVGCPIQGVLNDDERVDFLFAEYGLVIEADGPHHLEPVQRAIDRRRDRDLRKAGYRVLRFWWYEIEDEPAKVLDAIRIALSA
jgi:very-short-patch-repair endonuclease